MFTTYPEDISRLETNISNMNLNSPTKAKSNCFTQPKNCDPSQDYICKTPPKDQAKKLSLEMFTSIKLLRHQNKSKKRNVSPVKLIFDDEDDMKFPDFPEEMQESSQYSKTFQKKNVDMNFPFPNIFTNFNATNFNTFGENPQNKGLYDQFLIQEIEKIIGDINTYKDYEEDMQITLINKDLSLVSIQKPIFFEKFGSIMLCKETPPISHDSKFLVNGFSYIFDSNNGNYVQLNSRFIFGIRDLNKIVLEKIELHSY